MRYITYLHGMWIHVYLFVNPWNFLFLCILFIQFLPLFFPFSLYHFLISPLLFFFLFSSIQFYIFNSSMYFPFSPDFLKFSDSTCFQTNTVDEIKSAHCIICKNLYSMYSNFLLTKKKIVKRWFSQHTASH